LCPLILTHIIIHRHKKTPTLKTTIFHHSSRWNPKVDTMSPEIKNQQTSMSAETIRSVRTNEQGVQFLRQQRYESAIEKFGSSLRTLNQVLSSQFFAGEDVDQVEQQVDQDMPDAHGMEDHDNSTSFIEEVIPSTPACIGTSACLPQCLGDARSELSRHQSLIYKKPISVSKFLSLLQGPTPSYTVVVEMSISVMFNFALAHHLFAVSGHVQDPERVLEQAVTLYELTHSLQLQEGIELSLEYTMGTICNLGHAHRLRGDTDKSTKCFQHLLSIFCFLQSQNSVEQEHGTIEPSDGTSVHQQDQETSSSSPAASLRKLLDTDVFYHSVSHLLLSDRAAAAA
jgi:hypothetical protein